jgi:hypothetical protein
MTNKRVKHKLNLNLDEIFDLFSFFTTFDLGVSRQVCRWWNDLLTKDHVTLKQIKKNTSFEYDLSNINRSFELGYLNLIKWAGYIWDSYAYDCTARGGHLKILKWARVRGCEWDSWTCVGASRGGHLKILKWVRSKGCVWNLYTCVCAKNFPHIKNYIHSLPLSESPCRCPRIVV